MDNTFKIYIDRLVDGHSTPIDETVPPNFLDVNETELLFPYPVRLHGQTYLANDHLVIQLVITTKAKIPCVICNEFFEIPIVISDFYHAEPLADIKSKIFDFSEAVREAILLLVPQFAECHNGKCPERASIQGLIKKDNIKPTEKPSDPPTHFPFADLGK